MSVRRRGWPVVVLAVLAAGCVHWSGPSRVATRQRVLVTGEDLAGAIETTLLGLFDRDPRYSARFDPSRITSNDEACALGRARGADLVIWQTARVEQKEMRCLRGTNIGGKPFCAQWYPGNLNEVDISIGVHAVAIDASCTARDVFTGSAHREDAPRDNYSIFSLRKATRADLAKQLEPAFDAAFSTSLTIVHTDGATAAVEESPFRIGDTLRVVRGGERVGDVVVSAADARVSTVQAFAGDVRLAAGDRLEAGGRWCCVEFGATSNVARVQVGDAHQWAASVGAALRWYAARSSPAFELELDRMGLPGARIYRGTFGGGYRWWVVPRRLALLGTAGVGLAPGFRTFQAMHLQSTHPLAYARLGAQLRLLDWLWLTVAVQVDTQPRHDEWYKGGVVYTAAPQDVVVLSPIGTRFGLAVRY